jgi:predicted DNA-binding transcriptional regulator AlpA
MSLQKIARIKMRLLDDDQVDAKIGESSKTTKWRKAKGDRFPQPVKDGGENRWLESEIDSYIRWCIALRDGTTKIERWSEWWATQTDTQAAA